MRVWRHISLAWVSGTVQWSTRMTEDETEKLLESLKAEESRSDLTRSALLRELGVREVKHDRPS